MHSDGGVARWFLLQEPEWELGSRGEQIWRRREGRGWRVVKFVVAGDQVMFGGKVFARGL